MAATFGDEDSPAAEMNPYGGGTSIRLVEPFINNLTDLYLRHFTDLVKDESVVTMGFVVL